MKRREFIRLAGIAAASPLSVRAQQPERIRLIAVLGGLREDDPMNQPRLAALFQGLRELGWIEGKNFRFDYRWVTNDADRMLAIVQEMVKLHPDLLLSLNANPPVVAALMRETATIPILFVNTAEPVGEGITPSLSRPIRNVTGLTNFEYAIGGKWMDLLKKAAPNMARAALMFNPDTAPHGFSYVASFESAANFSAVEPNTVLVRNVTEIERALSALGKGNGLVVVNDTFTASKRTDIIALASQYELPAVGGFRYFPDEGLLMSYGPELLGMHRRSASYIDRLLKGESPASLPIEQPTKYDLVINLKTARKLGLDLPQMLLSGADEIIE